MSYTDAIDYLYSLKLVGIKLGLDNIRRALACMGDPQASLRFIHIAGTNGKGSTAMMLSAILQRCGLRVGLYTSPHLRSFCERIRVDGAPAPKDEIAALVESLRDLQTHPPSADPDLRKALANLTFFEFTTILALLYFQRHSVDWVVWETGLGGRLDATNVVTPEACIMTPIYYDHQDYLGDTIERIAAEKAGIIKPGVPVVSAPQMPEVMDVLKRRCGELGAPLIEAASACEYSPAQESSSSSTCVAVRTNRFNLRTPRRTYADLALAQPGEHQRYNAAVALLACENLERRGRLALRLPAAAREALAEIELPGRFQLLQERPWVVLDGAHNPAAMAVLARCLQNSFPNQPLTLILGIMRDKDLDGMLREIVPYAQRVIIALPQNERSAESRDLSRCVESFGVPCQEASSVGYALDEALGAAQHEEVICVSGSFYTVGEALDHWDAQFNDLDSAVVATGAPRRALVDSREMRF